MARPRRGRNSFRRELGEIAMEQPDLEVLQRGHGVEQRMFW